MKRLTLLPTLLALYCGITAHAQIDDWAKKKMILRNAEADLIVRVGDIDNFNQNFPADFNVFAGKPAPAHTGNIKILKDDPAGTDRIMVSSGFTGRKAADNYAKTSYRPDNLPQSVTLAYDLAGIQVETAVVQLFIDDLQAPVLASELQVKLNGKRVPEWEKIINRLSQTQGVGKLLNLTASAAEIESIKTGKISLLIDDPASGAGEGFSIDFVRLIVNPKIFYFNSTLIGRVTDKSTGKPLTAVKVSAGLEETYTDRQGNFQLSGMPAGFTAVTYSFADFHTTLLTTDLVAGEQKMLNVSLERQQVSGTR